MGPLLLLLAPVVIAGTIVAQLYLSSRVGKWPGLILPCFTLLLSLVVFFRALVFTAASTEPALAGPALETTTDFVRAAFLFLYCNVPTTLLLVIYAACGGQRRRRREEYERIGTYDFNE